MKLVLDASVIIKWFVSGEEEDDQEQANQLFKKVRSGAVHMIQPVHWQAEVIAVLSRVMPDKVQTLIPLLGVLAEQCADSVEIYQRAAEISGIYQHHLFDTLYHAVALEKRIILITDDRKYFDKTAALGCICLLKDAPELFEN